MIFLNEANKTLVKSSHFENSLISNLLYIADKINFNKSVLCPILNDKRWLKQLNKKIFKY